MARTNVAQRKPTLYTHEGAPTKRIGNEAQLRRSVMSCLLWENEFYEDGQSIAERIAEGVAGVSQETAAAIAIEAREKMYLRHVPLWIVRHMAPRGGRIVGDTLARVIQRADELSEFLALYWMGGKAPLSAQVKRGLAEAFGKFNAYALAKYDRAGSVRLRDVLFLAHPKPKDEEQAALWKQLVDNQLPIPDTWETELSAGKDKLETWTRLLTERKLGGLALLRNLRNMQQVNVPLDVIRGAIAENKFKYVLPFRFLAAANFAPLLVPELEQAMFRSLSEAPKLPGRTVILIDHSGSMIGTPVSAKSDVDRFDAACALAILLREVCEQVAVLAFSSNAWVVPAYRGFALRDTLKAGEFGSTQTELGKQLADKTGYDRLIIVTDEQSHTTLSNPNGRGYVINVASAKNGIGYGQWTHIDGWSESVVRYIAASEGQSVPSVD